MDEVAARSRTGVLSLASSPRDLERLKALVRGAAILLVGDSGPRFIAAAFGVPCVAVLGPTFLELTLPTPSCRTLEISSFTALRSFTYVEALTVVCRRGDTQSPMNLSMNFIGTRSGEGAPP